MVADFYGGPSFSSPDYLTRLSGEIFLFSADDGDHGRELWKSDGSAEGTVMVADLEPGPRGSVPTELTNAAGLVFFSASTEDSGKEVWTTDGSQAGTALLKEIGPGSESSFPAQLTNVSDTLFFVAVDDRGRELWKTDGTETGTMRLRMNLPGEAQPFVDFLTPIDGRLAASRRRIHESSGLASGVGAIVQQIYEGLHGRTQALALETQQVQRAADSQSAKLDRNQSARGQLDLNRQPGYDPNSQSGSHSVLYRLGTAQRHPRLDPDPALCQGRFDYVTRARALLAHDERQGL